MARIYYADDEKDIRDIVAAFLRNDGYEVETFETGDLLLEKFLREPCDLIILDIMMPGTDGIGILTEIRRVSTVPVILLTARDTDSDYYSGLALGSDDYITKPFRPIILSARVHALLRRVQYEKQSIQVTGPAADAGAVQGSVPSVSVYSSTDPAERAGMSAVKNKEQDADLSHGNLRFDSRQHQFFVNSELLHLTPMEMKYLIFMMKRFNEAVSKDEILDQVWGISSDIQSRTVDETNRRLRRKLTASGASVYIQTVWGYGFKMTWKDAGEK